MRLLANENIPSDAVAALRAAGHDVTWMRETAPGESDAEVIARAVAEQRILLTFDKDFGELAFHSKLPATCGVLLFRIPTPSAEAIAARLTSTLAARSDWAGRFWVVESDRIRMRELPKI